MFPNSPTDPKPRFFLSDVGKLMFECFFVSIEEFCGFFMCARFFMLILERVSNFMSQSSSKFLIMCLSHKIKVIIFVTCFSVARRPLKPMCE